MRTTMTGVFRNPEAALLASEQLRELNQAAGSIRLFLPGENGAPVELQVVRERSPWLRVTAWGVAVGIIFMYVSLSMARSWIYAIVALISGALFGLLLAGWLGGQRYPRSVRPHMRKKYLDLVRSGRGVLLVEVIGSADDVRQLMEESGAYVSEGYWPVRDTLQPV
ncbi:MAG: hypothetical protein JWN44_6800 [Myxococcales bacterium]|nr:hypothetical protein [Myxococcales bacterium]